MTDEQIIKALECCRYGGRCEECPCFDIPNCKALANDNALALINRQKAEIEEQDQAIINALHRMGEIRAEAVKEFAERLKQERKKIYPLYTIDLFAEVIDNLVKEFTEGERE